MPKKKQKTIRVKKPEKIPGYKSREQHNKMWHQLETKGHIGGTIKVPVGTTDDALEEFRDDKNAKREKVTIDGVDYHSYELKADEVEETEV